MRGHVAREQESARRATLCGFRFFGFRLAESCPGRDASRNGLGTCTGRSRSVGKDACAFGDMSLHDRCSTSATCEAQIAWQTQRFDFVTGAPLWHYFKGRGKKEKETEKVKDDKRKKTKRANNKEKETYSRINQRLLFDKNNKTT